MQVYQWLQQAASRLHDAGVGTARLDALVLLEDCLGVNRGRLLAHPETELTHEQTKLLDEQISRRALHEPLAYIRGKTEFYGREFYVDNYVLEPRPESEMMIDLLKGIPEAAGSGVADIGSGSGCLGITAALELGLKQVDFYDIDPKTLAVARRNAQRYGIPGRFHEADLLTRPARQPDIVLANLPYVPDGFHINEAAGHEPRQAIFGGPDGLDVYRRLFRQAAALPAPPSCILTESLPPQHEELAEIAASSGYKLNRQEDFIQLFHHTSTGPGGKPL